MKRILILIFVIVIIIAAVVLVGGIFAYRHFQPHQQQSITNIPQKVTIQQPNTTQPAGQYSIASWKIFKDSYGFQMQYPADSSIMNVPTSKIVNCNGSCPSTMIVPGGMDSAFTNQKINGVDYCIYSGDHKGSGKIYGEYFYLTVSGKTCYGLDASYSYVDCNIYKDNTAKQNCASKENANLTLVLQATSSIKFAPAK